MERYTWAVAHVLPNNELNLATILSCEHYCVWLPLVDRGGKNKVPLIECYCGFRGGEKARQLVRDARLPGNIPLLWDGGILEWAQQDELIASMRLIDMAIAHNPALTLCKPLTIGDEYTITRGPFRGKLCRLDETHDDRDEHGKPFKVAIVAITGGGVFANRAVPVELAADALEPVESGQLVSAKGSM